MKRNGAGADQTREVNPPLFFLRKIVLMLLLFILVFTLFCNTLMNGFVYDDTSMIKNNPAIRDARYIKLYFTRPFFTVGQPMTGLIEYDYYRPLILVSYYVDHLLFDLSPTGYHLTNILLHSVAVILFFLVLGRLGLRAPLSFLAAAFFAVHPAVADAVAGVSGRSDPLCALFLLSSLYCYLILRQHPARLARFLFPAYLITFALALLTKENAIAFPLLLTAYEVCNPSGKASQGMRKRLNNLLPSYGVAVLYMLIRSAIVPGTLGLRGYDIDLLSRATTAAMVAGNYLLMALFPVNLYFEMFTPQAQSLLSLRVALPLAVSLIGAGALIALRKRAAAIAFFLAWFYIFLLPFSYFFLFHPEPVFFTPPHFLYLPLMGIVASLALAGEKASRTRALTAWKGAPAAAALALILCIFAVQTVRRNTDWRDEFTFFSRMVRHNPQSPRIHIGMANTFLNRGNPQYALAQYARAYVLAKSIPTGAPTPDQSGPEEPVGTLQIADYYAAAARAGMGDSYLSLNEVPLAIENYAAASAENAFDSTIHYRLARAYEITGYLDKALAGYDQALKLNRNFADAASSRQIVLMKQEVYEQAKRVYLTSHLSGREKSADAFYGEAVMLRLSGKRNAAEALFREAADKDPLHFGANLALGQILTERGLYEEAFGNFSAAFASKPTSAVVAKELALTNLVLKDTVAAAQWAAKAYELAPDEHYAGLMKDMQRIAGNH